MAVESYTANYNLVAFSKQQNILKGSGIGSFLAPFTVNKFGNEMHARSLGPKHFLHGYTHVWPGTEIKQGKI